MDPEQACDGLIGKLVGYSTDDGSKRAGMAIRQAEAEPLCRLEDGEHF